MAKGNAIKLSKKVRSIFRIASVIHDAEILGSLGGIKKAQAKKVLPKSQTQTLPAVTTASTRYTEGTRRDKDTAIYYFDYFIFFNLQNFLP